MTTNKERLEALEAGFGGIQDGMQRLEETINRRLEETVNRLSEVFLSTKHNSNNPIVRQHREEIDGSRQIFSSKMAKLEFPRYSGDDPTEWFNRVAQFFEFQGTTDNQKVSLASFHLKGGANQWWQWLRRTY